MNPFVGEIRVGDSRVLIKSKYLFVLSLDGEWGDVAFVVLPLLVHVDCVDGAGRDRAHQERRPAIGSQTRQGLVLAHHPLLAPTVQ